MAERSSSKITLSLVAKEHEEDEQQQKTEEVITSSKSEAHQGSDEDEGADGGAPDGGEEEDEEDLVDPMDTLRESCKQQRNCDAMVQKLDACSARVESRSKNREECVEELLDLVHCVDDCVSKQIHYHWK